MNRSLKLLAALSLSALMFAAPTFAEGDGGTKKEGGDKKGAVEGGAKKEGQRGGAAADRLQAMADKLNLTADQKTQAAPIIAETREAVQKIMADTTLDRQAKQPKIMEVVKSGQEKLTAILTPEQKAELEKAKAEAREGAGKRGAKDGENAKKGPKDTGAPKAEK